jgi:dUTP pyrophosphatase
MGKFMGFFYGKPLVSAPDPFEAQDTPTVLLHVQEGPLEGVSGTLKLYSANELFPFGPLVIKFKRLHPDAKVPTRKYISDAGLDIYSLETVYIGKHSQAVLRTGIALADAPHSCVIQVWSKSGLDARLGLHVGAGIVDPNYRGEILVLLKNMSNHSVGINKGDAIAQLVIVPCMRPEIEIVDDVEMTDRGKQGGINDNKARGR